jgi:hypothetical protein
MIPQLLAIILGSQITIAVADQIPNFNVEPSCSYSDNGALGVTQDKTACLKDESDAHDQIARQWTEFTPADRAACVAASSGWQPTYTELLTCLEMFRDVRKLHAESPTASKSNPAHP